MSDNPHVLRVSRGPVELRSLAECGKALQCSIPEKLCTASTVSAAGAPECAIVGFAVLSDGALVLHTHKFSRKWANLRSRPMIALSVFTGTYAPYFQIEGTVELFDSGARHELLEAAYVAEHPKARVLMPKIGTGTIRVAPKWVRCYAWPRESGHCVEWLIDEQQCNTVFDARITLRNAYESENNRVVEFVRNCGATRTIWPDELILIAEVNEELAGAVIVQFAPPVIVISGPWTASGPLHESIANGLVELALQVANDHECLATPTVTDEALFIKKGFSVVPPASIPCRSLHTASGVNEQGGPIALRRPGRTL